MRRLWTPSAGGRGAGVYDTAAAESGQLRPSLGAAGLNSDHIVVEFPHMDSDRLGEIPGNGA
jgi:hypothetical protein